MTEEDRPTGRTKLDAQVGLIVKAMAQERPRRPVGIEPRDWQATGQVDYLYEREVILVRDEDLPRVRPIVGGGEERDSLINGVTLVDVGGRHVPDVLREIDLRLGVGVATPNHVLSVCPILFCPATEPEEPQVAGPDPAPCGHPEAGRDVLVSVVDTGLLTDATAQHTWLAGVTGDAEDAFDPGGQIRPYGGHGTFIAGVLRCAAPAAEVVVEGAFTHAGADFESEIVKQLDEGLNRGPDIISLSAGSRSRDNIPLLGIEVFYERRLRHYKGVVMVAAAGNDGDRGPFWPAAFPWTVSVGALAANWRSRAYFSNHGGWVDVYAPGEGLVNAYATGTFVCHEPPNAGTARNFQGMARWSGTSFSTPLVAGLIAARMSRTGENGRLAADVLLAQARAQAMPGVGAVLLPCGEEEHGGSGGSGCGCGCGCHGAAGGGRGHS